MRATRRILMLTIAALALAGRAEAVAVLQLDILGGYYERETGTIISNGPYFRLVALLTPQSASDATTLLGQTWYISAAVTPQTTTNTPLGTLTWNDETLDVTGDMIFGTPPAEELHTATQDPGDLETHEIFPTYFTEFAFQFSPSERTTTYNASEDPGMLTPSPTGGTYYQTFIVDVGLLPEYQIHFDLYDTYMRTCLWAGTCNPDEDIDRYASAYSDAQSGPLFGPPSAVPEPATLAALVIGLTCAGLRARFSRRRSTTHA